MYIYILYIHVYMHIYSIYIHVYIHTCTLLQSVSNFHCTDLLLKTNQASCDLLFLCDQLQKAETSEADEVDEEPAVVQSAQLFAPKSLVLVSRLDYTEVFRVRSH